MKEERNNDANFKRNNKISWNSKKNGKKEGMQERGKVKIVKRSQETRKKRRKDVKLGRKVERNSYVSNKNQ